MKFRECEGCGVSFLDEHDAEPELCMECWKVPQYIPREQVKMYYKILKERYEYSKMLLLRKTGS